MSEQKSSGPKSSGKRTASDNTAELLRGSRRIDNELRDAAREEEGKVSNAHFVDAIPKSQTQKLLSTRRISTHDRHRTTKDISLGRRW